MRKHWTKEMNRPEAKLIREVGKLFSIPLRIFLFSFGLRRASFLQKGDVAKDDQEETPRARFALFGFHTISAQRGVPLGLSSLNIVLFDYELI
jgi:hypothetical protein